MPFCDCGNFYAELRQDKCDNCLLENYIGVIQAALAAEQEGVKELEGSVRNEITRRCACEFVGSECISECRYHGKARSETERLGKDWRYMVGIAEKGTGEKCPKDMEGRKYLLDYVKLLESKEQVLLGIHDALGIKWGDDPYAVISTLRAEVERLRPPMNPNDYGSLEACQRLVKAGITLETERSWFYQGDTTWKIVDRHHWVNEICIPAPSMAEVWRELPDRIEVTRHNGDTCAVALLPTGRSCSGSGSNINPTDALIDLLIWVKQRKEKGNEDTYSRNFNGLELW
jgi:hypothetical protein